MPNISTFLDVNARYTKRPVLIYPARNESYTFSDLLSRTNALANALLAAGIGRGDRICIYLDNCPEHLIAYLASWRIGAVAVPANRAYREAELLHAVSDSAARAVVTDAAGEQAIREIREKVPALSAIISSGSPCAGALSLAEIFAGPDRLPAADCRFDDLCQLQYTAGTTGKPKGAMLTHGNWMAALDAEREVLSLTAEDTYLGIYPLGHVGFSWGLAALKSGARFVMMDRYEPERYLSLAEEYGVTVLSAMPPVLHTLLSSPPGTEERLATVRVAISGGGPLLPSIWEGFDRRYRIRIANAYGLSETIVVGSATCVLPQHYEMHRGYRSVGAPVGYAEIRIVDESDPQRELPPHSVGEIAVRGPAVAKGYWNLPAATTEVFLPGGWFLTGDLGYLDRDGILYVTDRKKDMINMSGWKIYPAEVENVLIQHPAIRDAAVFGRPDVRRGESPVAAVVLREGRSLDYEELARFCRERLAGYKVPRGMVVLPELPRVNGWKLLRRELREKFDNGVERV